MPITNSKEKQTPSPRWVRWDKTLQKLKTTKHNIEIDPSPHGEKWVRKMLAHWNKQIKEWKELEPTKFED